MSSSDLEQVLEAGTLLIIEVGEYSDRSWSGPVRILKTTKKAELVKRYQKTKNACPEDFLPWLIKAGFAESVENVHSWHVGAYDRFEP